MARGIPELSFTKDWSKMDPPDFPTYEDNEATVRADIQLLYNEIRDFINQYIVPETNSISASEIDFVPSEGVPENDVQSAIENVQAQLIDVSQGSIPDGSIGTVKLTDASITTAKLASEAVTTPKLGDASVTTAKLVDEAVTTAKLNNSAVTTPKLSDSAVTTAKLADGSVTTAKLADDAVTGAKVAAGALLEDVTNSITITEDSSHGVSSHLTFHYCRALGVMLVGGYVTITSSDYDYDINAQFRQSAYLPASAESFSATVTHGSSVYAVDVTAWSNGIWSLNSGYNAGTYNVSKNVWVNGWYLCNGA